MKILKTNQKILNWTKNRNANKTIGFVPTMGDLHQGHLSLIQRSKKENDLTVVSIFINPKQFDKKEDFLKYYKNNATDITQLKKIQADILFIPYEKNLYPPHFQTRVEVAALSQPLCGSFRKDHFHGVATIVLKLFNLVQPHHVYFGLKDFQQFRLIEQMVKDLNLNIKIIPCPIVREKDGLALSSRNRRLSNSERNRASSIYRALTFCANQIKLKKNISISDLNKHFSENLNLKNSDKMEYFNCVDPVHLSNLNTAQSPCLLACAVWIGNTRLIDNIWIKK